MKTQTTLSINNKQIKIKPNQDTTDLCWIYWNLLELSFDTKLLSKFDTIFFLFFTLFSAGSWIKLWLFGRRYSQVKKLSIKNILFISLFFTETKINQSYSLGNSQRPPPPPPTNINRIRNQSFHVIKPQITQRNTSLFTWQSSDVEDLYRFWQLPVYVIWHTAATVTCLNRFPLYRRWRLSEFSEMTCVTRSGYLPSAATRWEIL